LSRRIYSNRRKFVVALNAELITKKLYHMDAATHYLPPHEYQPPIQLPALTRNTSTNKALIIRLPMDP
jgi:hypothetical protein